MITKTLANIAALLLVGIGIASADAGAWSPWLMAAGMNNIEYSRTGSDAISSCGYVTGFQITSVR